MSVELDVTGQRVLVRGAGPRVAERVHALTEAGAVVTVQTADADPAVLAVLDDLASRQLIRLENDCVADDFDVVLRDRPVADRPGGDPPSGTGKIVLVGGGPGAPGLLTVAGLEHVRRADVLVCDRLAPLSVLEHARPDAQVVHVGKIPRGEFTPQQTINRLLVEHARAGRYVVRLKGGDGFVFGRGGEEWVACAEAGLPVEVVPGVSASVGVPALAGMPVTHRSLSQGFAVVSGHVAPEDPRSEVDWAALAASGLTIVVLMGVAHLSEIVRALTAAGLDPATPAGCVADGSMPSQRAVRAPLINLPKTVVDQGLSAPAITVIGPVVEALVPCPVH